jgi:hypothetical protein
VQIGVSSPVVLLSLALLAPSADARPTAAKPDLVVVSAKLTSKRWSFIDGRQTFAWHDVTRNVGRGHAPASHTGIRLTSVHARLRFASVPAVRPVAGLGATAASSGRRSESHAKGGGPLGAYRVEVCADVLEDVAETNEANNCKAVGNFYIGRRAWHGFLRSQLDYGGTATEFFYTPGKSAFVFVGYADGRFGYELTGAVEWDETGTDPDGCNYSGTGTDTDPDGRIGGLVLDYKRGRYSGYASLGNTRLYSIVRSGCGAESGASRGRPSRPSSTPAASRVATSRFPSTRRSSTTRTSAARRTRRSGRGSSAPELDGLTGRFTGALLPARPGD